MKILMINDHQKSGGSEVYLQDITDLLRKQGHEVFHFFAEKKSDSQNKIKHYINYQLFDYKLYKKLKNYIRKINPDIIHIHNNYFHTNSILLACGNKKIIQKVCDFGIVCPSSWGIKKSSLKLCNCKKGLKCGFYCYPFFKYFLDIFLPDLIKCRLIKKKTRMFITPSRILKQFMEKQEFQNVINLSNFKDENFWKPTKTKESHILFTGSLLKHKGINYLIKAIELISKKQEIKLLIIGKGPEERNLKQLVKSLNLEKNIQFLGYINNRKIKDYYNQALMVVVPSIWREQFPHAVLEAMAMQKPIIAFNTGGIPELIENNKTGILVQRLNYKELAEKIQFLLDNKKIREEFGKQARENYKKNYTSKTHLKKLLEAYNQLKNLN